MDKAELRSMPVRSDAPSEPIFSTMKTAPSGPAASAQRRRIVRAEASSQSWTIAESR